MRKRRTGIVLAGAVMLLLIVLGMYAGIGFYYRTHFLEHATINGTDNKIRCQIGRAHV